jgi:hypothetical protein
MSAHRVDIWEVLAGQEYRQGVRKRNVFFYNAGMGETMWVAENRFDAVDIPLSSISNVTLGEKWARDGLRLVIAPYAPGIDQIAKGRAVCFNAPDGEGRDSSYGLHMLTDDDAQELYRVLSEGAK